jgi:hypothetical protein
MGQPPPAKLLPPTYFSRREEKKARFRETREGLPLLTIETQVIGDSKSTDERGLSLVGSLIELFVTVQDIFVPPWLL